MVVIFQPFSQDKLQEPASCLACGFEGCLAHRCRIWFLRYQHWASIPLLLPDVHKFHQEGFSEAFVCTKQPLKFLIWQLIVLVVQFWLTVSMYFMCTRCFFGIIALLFLCTLNNLQIWHWHRGVPSVPQSNGPLANLLSLTQTIPASHTSPPAPPPWARAMGKEPDSW